MSNWISGKDLLQRWKIRDFELFSWVKKGLQPYSQTGRPTPPPDVKEKKSRLQVLQNELTQLKERRDRLNYALKVLDEKGHKGVPSHLAGEINLWIDEPSRGKKSIYEQVEKKEKAISSLKRIPPLLKQISWERYSSPKSESQRKKILKERVPLL